MLPIPVLGVDVGGVIVTMAGSDAADSSFFGTEPDRTPEQPGALETLRRLNGRFDGRVHIISKAGPRIEAVTRSWLSANDVYRRTGLRSENVLFVRTRSEKAPLAAKLGITHFLDDRVDVLQHMTSVAYRYLFLPGRDGTRGTPVPGWATPVPSWEAFEPLVHETVDEFRPVPRWRLPPAYWSLANVLDDAGVVLAPTDRDLAPADRHNNPDVPFEPLQREKGPSK